MPTLDNHFPKEDQRVEPTYVPISRTQLNGALAFFAAGLSAVSLLVVFQGANDEPYMGYRRYDAVVQVGVGTALMVLWCCCSVAVIVLVAARKLPAGWLALLLWAAICLFYLSCSPLGYLEDIEKFVIPAPAAVDNQSGETEPPKARGEIGVFRSGPISGSNPVAPTSYNLLGAPVKLNEDELTLAPAEAGLPPATQDLWRRTQAEQVLLAA